tara:strand:+ start:2396 stop:3487 length:1092 start_codon:yes stop_codon:yes gene_type:complete
MTDIIKPVFDSMRKGNMRVSAGGLNPTGASCVIKDELGNEKLIGKCHRQVWYSKTGVERSNFPDDKTFIKFAVGHAMEDNFQTHWNRMGILIDGNIKIKEDISDGDPRGPLMISGEADGLIRDFEVDDEGNISQISSTHAIGLEMKTNRGFFAKKEVYGIGNKRYPRGHPKLDHVMQTAMYLRMRWKLEEYYGVTIDSFRIVYCQVDDGLTTFFDISLSDGYGGEVIIKDRYGDVIKPDALASLEAGINLDPISGLTIENIMDRYYECAEKLKDDENPPERDYQLRYDEETFEKKLAAGDISKTAAGNWEKKPLAQVGDWQCRYCDWKEVCLPYGVLTKAVEAGLLTPEAALGQLGVVGFGGK